MAVREACRRGRRSGGRTALVVALVPLAGALVVAPARNAAALPSSGANPAWVLAHLTEAQRVGQLVMVGASLSGVSAATRAAVSTYHVGSVILTGRSSAGAAAVRSMAAGLQALATPAATGGVPLFVATDQEGGYVQTLSGPGFDTMPTALTQGGYAPGALLTSAVRWGGQLAAAGVNLDLAPVLDTVPASATSTNQPIGVYRREYGTDPGTVTTAGTQVVRGLHVAGVETAVKHFPGLGRASGNTDTTFGVTDTVTTRHDAYVAPFAAVTGTTGAGVVMVSLARYTRIDPYHRAVFSPTVLTGMLRGDLGFAGVIMSDSMDAAAVRDHTPGERAVGFVQAGGDLVLTTVPADVPAMVSALLARAAADPAFRARVDASCLRVLIAKQRAGLLPGAAAVAATGGREFVAERVAGARIGLYTRTAGTWSGPGYLASDSVRAPALAARRGTDGIEVAAVTRSGSVAVRFYSPTGGAAGWVGIGGRATSPPAVASSPTGRLAVAIRGTDLGLWLREFVPGVGWGAWTGIGGGLGNAAPALVYTPTGDLDAFVLGQTQAVYRNVRHAGRWSGWQYLGGVVESAPAVTLDPASGAITLFVEGTGHHVFQKILGAAHWSLVPGVHTVSAPAAAAPAPGTTVIVEQPDGYLYRGSRSGSSWSAWSALPFD